MIQFGEQITRHVPVDDGGTDALGNPTSTWSDSTMTAAVWPTVSSESTAGVDVITRGLTLLLPGAQALSGLDEWTVRGDRYRTEGDPGIYRSPLTGSEVTQVQLLRRT